jgi:DNA polymerase I
MDKSAQKNLGALCDACPLRDAPLVESRIPQGATHILVGEAPGSQEVAHGVPFVGDSGRLLAHELRRAGLDASRMGRTNAILCNASYKKDPDLQLAYECCKPRLQQELLIHEDAIVVALGSQALHACDIDYNITDVHGEFFHDGKLFATFNPAAILHDAGLGHAFRRDIEKLSHGYQAWNQKISVHVVTKDSDHMEALIEIIYTIPKGWHVAYDVETTNASIYGKQDQKPCELLCIVLAFDAQQCFIVPADMVEILRDDLTYLFKKMYCIAHNGMFDNQVLYKYGFTDVNLQFDTMLAHALIAEGKRGHGLKQLASWYFNAPHYEEYYIDRHFKNKLNKDYSKVPRSDLYAYAGFDGVLTYRLAKVLKDELCADGLWDLFESLTMLQARAFESIERHGIRVDWQYALQAAQYVLAVLETLEQQITESVGYHVNPNSPPQVQALLYKKLGLRHPKKLSYRTKDNSTNEEALKSLQGQHEVIDLILKYRQLQKLYSTYLVKISTLSYIGDRIHISFNLHGTTTGRVSAQDSQHGLVKPDSSDIFSQLVQGCYIASNNCVLVILDYQQAELRAFAHASSDLYLLKVFREGGDIHDSVGRELFKNDPHAFELDGSLKKVFRRLAKNFNFGFIYLGGVEAIASQIGLPLAVVRPLYEQHKRLLAGATAYVEQQIAFMRHHGYVLTATGRKRRFPLQPIQGLDDIRKAAINAPIQGGAADLLNLSISELVLKYNVPVVHAVHDSIIIDCPIDRADTTAALAERVMISYGEQYFGSVPWLVDLEKEKDGSFPTRLYPRVPEVLEWSVS